MLFRSPKQKDPFDQLIVELQGGVSSMLLEFQLGENSRYYKQLQQVKEMRGIQARLPFAIDFQ